TPPSSEAFASCTDASCAPLTGSNSRTVGATGSTGSVPRYAVHSATGIPSELTNTLEHVAAVGCPVTAGPGPGPRPGWESVDHVSPCTVDVPSGPSPDGGDDVPCAQAAGDMPS